jgi:uncharacterized protein YndB with AHSA1/START domain
MSPTDTAIVTTVVDVDPATAFDVFTNDIGLWWRREPRYRFTPHRPGILCFEPGAGGRLIEVDESTGRESFEVGRVLIWQPGARLVFEFRGDSFGPGDRTEVEVTFAAEGRGTRLTLEHRGWDRLPPGHPARQGYTGQAFTDMIGLRWADLLTAIRARARSKE